MGMMMPAFLMPFCVPDIPPASSPIPDEAVVNIPILQERNQGQEANCQTIQCSWFGRSDSSIMSSGQLKAPRWEAGSAFPLSSEVSPDLVLTELIATEQPSCLFIKLHAHIDLFVLWIYVKENQKQFSLAHLVSCKLCN